MNREKQISMSNYDLVSIVVVTYNSEKSIESTLNSIKQQTYSHIELIISDDCSVDNTVDICKKWRELNNHYFVCVKIIEAPENTGTVKNLNRGIKVSTGIWIKCVAGDDSLAPNAIADYISYVQTNKHVCICSAKLKLIPDDININLESLQRSYNKYFAAVSSNYSKQRKLIYGNTYVFPSPGWFFSRELYNEVGGFDERYVLMEEWPFANAVLKHGHRIYPLDKELIHYRVSSNSVSRQVLNEELGNKIFFDDYRKYFYKTRLWQQLFHLRFDLMIRDVIYFECRNAQYRNGINCWQGRVLNYMIRTFGRAKKYKQHLNG